MEGQRPTSNGAEQFRGKPIDARSTYSPGVYGPITDVQSHRDLMSAGIFVSPDAVRATWGDEAAKEYQAWNARTFGKADVCGVYAPNQRITIATPDDVIDAGMSVSYQAAEQTWGREAANLLRKADAAAIRSRIENRGIPVNGIPKTVVVFSR